MATEVERLDRRLHEGLDGSEEFLARPGQGQHAPVVVGVEMDVEQEVTARRGEDVDRAGIATLAHVHRRREVARAHGAEMEGVARGVGSAGSGDAVAPTGPEDPAALPLRTTAPDPVIDPVGQGIL